MPLLEQRIPHLLSGVSQRPKVELGRSQLQVSDNWLARLTMGLIKRPPFEYVGKLDSSTTGVSSAATFSLNRNDSERFRMVVQNGGVKVFDVLNGGAELTVEDRRESGTTYFDAVAGSSFRATTVGNDTYIVNQGVETAKGSKKTPAQEPYALVNVEQADFSTTYRIVLIPIGEGFDTSPQRAFATTTPDQTSATVRSEITTEAIAADLIGSNTAPQYNLFTATQYGSTVHIVRSDGGDFIVNVTDGLGGNGLRVVKGRTSMLDAGNVQGVESVEDLANVRGPADAKLIVAGDPSTDRDDYWVKYETVDGDPSGQQDGTWGRWVETIAPNTLQTVDSSTMPHRLRWKGTQLNGLQPITPLPPAFHVGTLAGVESVGGYTEDESGNTRADVASGADTEIHGEGYQRLIPGANGATTQQVTVRFRFDNANAAAAGEQAIVYIYHVDSGGTVTLLESTYGKNIHGGGFKTYTGGELSYTLPDRVWATDDKVRIVLGYVSGATPASELERASLTIDGYTVDQAEDEPISAIVPGGAKITIPAGSGYRDGMEAIIKLANGADEFTYSVAEGDGAAEVASGLQALIDADATYTATVSSREISVTETADATVDPDCNYARTVFADDTAVINPRRFINIYEGFTTLNIIANAFTGETIRNTSDGSSATITSNTAAGKFVCAGLTGGADNTFQPGDQLEIVGTGDYFILEPVLWTERKVGTDITNSMPSFVEHTINDVFLFRNRLGFLTGENIVFSQSGELENFFRTTTVDVVDGDRIDVSSAQPNTADFQHAVLWNRGLYIWSDLAQYEVSGEPVLSPKTIRIDLISRFPNSRDVPPVVAGRRLLFCHQQEGHVRLHEWIPPTDSEPRFQAPDVSEEVPTYLPGKPVDLAADYSHGVVAVLCDGDADAVYLYSFADNFQGERTMAAWQRMTLPPGVTAMQVDFIDGKMGLVYTYDEGVFLDEADFDQPARGDSDVVVYLDRQVTATDLTVSPNGGNTNVTLPYETDTNDSEGVTEFYDKTSGASISVVSRVDRDTFTITGSHAAGDIVAGIAWTATATLAPVYLRDQQDSPETGGRCQVRYLEVQYNRTQDLKIEVTPVGRSAYTYSVSETSLSEGQQRASVMARGEDTVIKLISDDPGDARVSSIDVEMFLNNRARRV